MENVFGSVACSSDVFVVEYCHLIYSYYSSSESLNVVISWSQVSRSDRLSKISANFSHAVRKLSLNPCVMKEFTAL